MSKGKKLYIISLGFLVVSLVFVVLLMFTKVTDKHEEYILVEQVFSNWISTLFFILIYAISAATLSLNLLSIFKNNYIIQRMSFFIKMCFVILLFIPFFSGVYGDFAHVAYFFIFNILSISFLLISLIIEFASIRKIEDNIHRDELINKYRLIINFDYFLLLICGLIIIISSFIIGDFYLFYSNYLPYIPFYFLPTLSLIFYIYNAYRFNYLSSRYFSFIDIIKSRFIYYFVAYLSTIRLGYFAYSNYSFYSQLKILRMILFFIFIAIIIFNSFLPKIDLSFLLAGIIITLFTFEVIGMIEAVNGNNDMVYAIISFLFDYIILLLLALPYYVFVGVENVFIKHK